MLRTWLYATPNEGFARKTASHLSFMLSSVLLGWRASGPADTVVVSGTLHFVAREPVAEVLAEQALVRPSRPDHLYRGGLRLAKLPAEPGGKVL